MTTAEEQLCKSAGSSNCTNVVSVANCSRELRCEKISPFGCMDSPSSQLLGLSDNLWGVGKCEETDGNVIDIEQLYGYKKERYMRDKECDDLC